VVKRDRQVVAASALGVATRVDPGEHLLSTEATGRPAWEQRITLAEGEKKQVTLEVRAPPAAETTTPAPTLPLAAPPAATPPDEAPKARARPFTWRAAWDSPGSRWAR
jgi:hypothetical protein